MTKETIVAAPIGVAGEYPGQQAELTKGGVHVFTNLKARDAMWPLLKDANTVALVGIGENGYPSWYKWESNKWNFEGYFGGMVLADTDGALTRVDSTAVFGPDFAIQAAGDTGNGILIVLSDKVKQELASKIAGGDGMITVGTYGDAKTFGKGATLEFEAPLVAFADPDKEKAFRVTMEHGYFERAHAEGYLAYFQGGETIIGATTTEEYHKGTIWADNPVWGSNNVFLYTDRNNKAMVLQEGDTLDPNVSGGMAIFCGLYLGLVGEAQEAGTIKAVLFDHTTGKVLTNPSGQPIGVTHHYAQGDKFNDLLALDIYKAKGAVNACWSIWHTFNSDPVRLEDWVTGNSCVIFQEYTKTEGISPALNQFQLSIGKYIAIEPKYFGIDMFSTKWAFSQDLPEADVAANAGENSVIGMSFLNPTPLKASVTNGQLHVKDDGTHMALFAFGDFFTEEDTKAMRGKDVSVKTTVLDKYNATCICMYVYKGDLATVDKKFLKGKHNMQDTLATGWTRADSAFIPENATGQVATVAHSFTIPTDADLVAIMICPQEEQSPLDIVIDNLEVSADPAFETYLVNALTVTGQHPLHWSSTSAQFHTRANIRWTINKAKTNLPFGERKVGKAPIKLISSKDDAASYVGGLEVESDGDWSFHVYVNMYAGEGIPAKGTSTTKFWVEDVDGAVVADSTSPDTVLKAEDKTPHYFSWIFSGTFAKGAQLKLYASSTVDDGAYVQSASYDAVGTVATQTTM